MPLIAVSMLSIAACGAVVRSTALTPSLVHVEAGHRRAGTEQGRVGRRQVHRDLVVGVVVGADLERAVVGAVEQLLATERRGVGDPVELGLQLGDLGVGGGLRVGVLRTGVAGLDGQVPHALQDGGRLVQRAVRGLHDVDAVLGVAHGDGQATDLRLQAVRDGQAGCVVGRLVDPKTAGQLLQRAGHRVVGDREVPVRVHCRDVRVDAKTHDVLLRELCTDARPWAAGRLIVWSGVGLRFSAEANG